jgi:hypothetical protein
MEKRSYGCFERRRKTKALEIAYEQIRKAFDTVTWLNSVRAYRAFIY